MRLFYFVPSALLGLFCFCPSRSAVAQTAQTPVAAPPPAVSAPVAAPATAVVVPPGAQVVTTTSSGPGAPQTIVIYTTSEAARAVTTNEYPHAAGQPVPEGYHLESRPRQGLVTAGAVTFGVMYGISLSIALSSHYSPDGWLYVPVIGPGLDANARSNDPCTTTYPYTTSCNRDDGTTFLFTIDTLTQAAGAALLIIGLASRREMVVRNYADGRVVSSWSVVPTVTRTSQGLGVVGQF